MINYSLTADEVILYKGFAKRTQDDNSKVEIWLTNHNIILEETINDIVKVEICPIESLKIYKGVPQVKHSGLNVEMYFTSGEQFLLFDSRIEIHKFVKAVYELTTGKTQFERGALKVKKGIATTDDALGIDTVETIKSTVIAGFKIASIASDVKASILAINKKSDMTDEEKANATRTLKLDKGKDIAETAMNIPVKKD